MLLTKKSSLLDLPDGLLSEIVWQFEADDHSRLGATCKRLKHIALIRGFSFQHFHHSGGGWGRVVNKASTSERYRALLRLSQHMQLDLDTVIANNDPKQISLGLQFLRLMQPRSLSVFGLVPARNRDQLIAAINGARLQHLTILTKENTSLYHWLPLLFAASETLSTLSLRSETHTYDGSPVGIRAYLDDCPVSYVFPDMRKLATLYWHGQAEDNTDGLLLALLGNGLLTRLTLTGSLLVPSFIDHAGTGLRCLAVDTWDRDWAMRLPNLQYLSFIRFGTGIPPGTDLSTVLPASVQTLRLYALALSSGEASVPNLMVLLGRSDFAPQLRQLRITDPSLLRSLSIPLSASNGAITEVQWECPILTVRALAQRREQVIDVAEICRVVI